MSRDGTRPLAGQMGDGYDLAPAGPRLLHYSSDANLTLDRARNYDAHVRADKPAGLWLSVDTAWREWREGESWGIPKLEYVYEIALTPHANVLRVTTEKQLRGLHRKFPRNRIDDVMPFFEHYKKYPSWPAMMERFDGIVITEYLYSCRFDPDWYYGWDCASGCIWNLGAIAAVRHVESLPAAAPGRADD